ncbi:MAG: Ppx/GppA phosphatase family protein [Deltaproteobacteria bacterium]|nr:Ppx/GppA phosphatase family protein [Deltaproteobacteria bacterium]
MKNGTEPATFAAIDVGSNAMRMKIVGLEPDGAVTTLCQQRAPVRLGHEVFLTGFLNDGLIQKAVEAFGEFRDAIDRWKVRSTRAIATSATREAINGDVLVERVYSRTGIHLERITGAEEARLVQLAVSRKLNVRDKTALVIDIGGGSVEFDIIDHGSIVYSSSLRLGAVRMHETFLRSERVSDLQVLLLRAYMDQLVEATLNEVNEHEIDLIVGTGGNVEDLAALIGTPSKREAEGIPEDVRFIPLRGLQTMLKELSRLSVAQRQDKYGMKPDRADVVLPATIVLSEVVSKVLGSHGIYSPDVGLKDGVLVEIIDRFKHSWDTTSEETEIIKAAATLGQKYHFHLGHARQVRYLSELLFDQLKPLHGLPAEARMLLRVAATLHDIGDFVSLSGHHKHSFYLIRNSDIVGLGGRQLELIANVARYHRKAFPNAQKHEPFRALSESEREWVGKLAAILRVADALDHEHRSTVNDLKVRIQRRSVTIDLQSMGPCLLERWQMDEKARLFQEVFGRSIELLVNGRDDDRAA